MQGPTPSVLKTWGCVRIQWLGEKRRYRYLSVSARKYESILDTHGKVLDTPRQVLGTPAPVLDTPGQVLDTPV